MRVAVQLVLAAVAGGESAHGTTHPPAAAIVDAAGDRWSIQAGGLMVRNGVQAAYDLWALLLWWSGELYGQQRADRGGGWFKRIAGSWGWEFAASADPRDAEPPPPPPPPPIESAFIRPVPDQFAIPGGTVDLRTLLRNPALPGVTFDFSDVDDTDAPVPPPPDWLTIQAGTMLAVHTNAPDGAAPLLAVRATF